VPANLQPLLAACVFVMMLCIGLDFSLRHWRQLMRQPLPLLLGILAQNLVVPAAGFAVAWLFRSTPEIALGIVLVVASPGGPVANAIVHLARARIDVSVSLTALNGVLGLLTVPLIANWGFILLAGDQVDLRLPLWPTLQHIVLIILLPIGLGVLIQQCGPPALLNRLARRSASIMLLLILGLVFVGCAGQIAANWQVMLPAAILLCSTLLVFSHGFARALGAAPNVRFAIATEVSIHNVPMAILFAEGLLRRPELAAFIAIYAPVIAALSLSWALWLRRMRAQNGHAEDAAGRSFR